jgi:hypothetical protein
MVKDSIINRPIINCNEHPIYTCKHLISSNEFHTLFNTAKRWDDSRFLGGLIYGRPNSKSIAIEYLSRQLSICKGDNSIVKGRY